MSSLPSALRPPAETGKSYTNMADVFRSCLVKTNGVTAASRWTPKLESLVLDGITPDSHPLFRYILTRNGHNVALYGGLSLCEADMKDRSRRFPADDWAIVDRQAVAQ